MTRRFSRVVGFSARWLQTRRAFSNTIFSRKCWPIFKFLFLKRYYSSRETNFVVTKLSYSAYFGFLLSLNFNLIINGIIIKNFHGKIIFFILDTFCSITGLPKNCNFSDTIASHRCDCYSSLPNCKLIKAVSNFSNVFRSSPCKLFIYGYTIEIKKGQFFD